VVESTALEIQAATYQMVWRMAYADSAFFTDPKMIVQRPKEP
jgi:hypothetical protein